MDGPAPWWHPEVFARRAPALAARGRIKQAVRQHLASEGFVEVETSVLQISPGNETHITAFSTQLVASDGRSHPFYLHTSPEFACKKLLAAGVDRLFTFAPVFRNRERGPLHHPEFTMLEWYRAGASSDALIADCGALMRAAAQAVSASSFTSRGRVADPFAAPEILTVCEAFRRYAGLHLESMLPHTPAGIERFSRVVKTTGLRMAADDTWSDLFSKMMSVYVEPNLGIGRATILTRYPSSEAALARPCRDDPRFAERFEVYCCGVELANAFAELKDVSEQRRRFEAAEVERQRIYGEAYPIDEDLLAALAIMPEAVGIALGFDRLVMLATGAEKIEDVLWAPVSDRAS